jgi:Zn-finger protein
MVGWTKQRFSHHKMTSPPCHFVMRKSLFCPAHHPCHFVMRKFLFCLAHHVTFWWENFCFVQPSQSDMVG